MVADTRNVCDAEEKVVSGCCEIESSDQRHQLGALAGPFLPDCNHCCIVTVEENPATLPARAPSGACN